MIIQVDITQLEYEELKREYRRYGLGTEYAGNRPAPRLLVTKKVVDAYEAEETKREHR